MIWCVCYYCYIAVFLIIGIEKGMGRKFAIGRVTQQTYRIYLEDVARVFRRKISKHPKVPAFDRDASSSATRNDS